jgi:SAM-dependent methyltransferase
MEGGSGSDHREDVQELARAMREGMASRRFAGPAPRNFTPSARFTLETRNALELHADLVTFPPIAKPGPLSAPVRWLRQVWKALLRPWLGVQTEFNRLTLEALQNAHHELLAHQARIEECVEGIKQCYNRAVNCELGHNGRIARGGLWFNPAVSVELRDEGPVVTGVSERILEHMFVHTRLPRPPARVLDLGCAESTAAIELASFGYQVQGVDLRSLPVYHPGFTMVHADVGRLPFADASYDAVVSLSTVEHVGLGWYTPVAAASSDREAVAEARRVLRPGGRFVLTIPFGRPATTRVHRVYDRAGLDELLAPLRRVETLFGVRDGQAWSVTADAEAAERADSAERVSAVALAVAERDPCTY